MREWQDVERTLPWIVDASSCMTLDCFVVSLYIYLQKRLKMDVTEPLMEEDDGGEQQAEV